MPGRKETRNLRSQVQSHWVCWVLLGHLPRLWSSLPGSCCGQTWNAKGVAVGSHIMCSAISPSVPACQDGWSGYRPQHTLTPNSAPDPGAKLGPPPSTSRARGCQLNLLSSMYVGAGLVNPRARGQGVDSEGGPLLPFPLAPVHSCWPPPRTTSA